MSLKGEEVAGLVLAGGEGRRMGRDKALVEWEGELLVHRQLRLLSSAGVRALALSRAPDQPEVEADIPILLDPDPGKGPLGGLVAGLEWAAALEPGGLPLLVLAVDMPRVDRALIERLLRVAGPGEGSAPRVEGRWEPLCAIYPPAALEPARRLLRTSSASPTRLLEELHASGAVTALELDRLEGERLRSWNTPDEPPGT